MNENIRVPEVRVVTDDGEHLGTMPTPKALAIAKENGQDLVIIQPNSEPPVAKIIDYGKYKYEKDIEKKQHKAKQKTVEVKGIRLSLRIGQHDLDVRKEQAKGFLDEGNKVKVEIILRGRERRLGDLAEQVIRKFLDSLNQEVPLKTEQPVTRQGGQLTSIVGKA